MKAIRSPICWSPLPDWHRGMKRHTDRQELFNPKMRGGFGWGRAAFNMKSCRLLFSGANCQQY